MTVRPIRLFGDPVLRRRADEVVDFDAELRALVTDVGETMRDAGGAGLAAPQLGVGMRVFTYRHGDEVGHLVNPRIEPVGAEQLLDTEGCLSIPGLAFDCLRHGRVVASGFSMHGEPVSLEGSERLARAFQHETDHLDGVLFVDRLDPQSRAAAMQAIAEAQWTDGAVLELRESPHRTGGRAF